MIGLIDGDLLCYRCGFAAQKNRKVRLEDGSIEHVREIEPLAHALHNVDSAINSLKAKFASIEIYLSGKNNWRKQILTYKANRSPFAKPVYYKEIRDHLINKYGAVVIDGAEADDGLGIRQTAQLQKQKEWDAERGVTRMSGLQ